MFMASDSYKKRAKILRKIGVMDIDLRLTLSPQKKAAITKSWNKHKSVANNLQDYAVKIVSSKTAKRIKDDTRLSVKTKAGKTKVFIPNFGQKVTIEKGHVVLNSKNFRQKNYPVDKNVFKTAEKLLANKKKGEYIMLKIGTSANFSTTFSDMATLRRYLENWKPKDNPTKKHKNNLISQLSVVVAKGRPPEKTRSSKKWQERKGQR